MRLSLGWKLQQTDWISLVEGASKIYSSQGICNLPCQKDNIGSGEEGKVIHLGRVLHSPLCTKSFQSPADLHAYHASLNERLFPAATCLFHLQTRAHTHLAGLDRNGGLPAFSTRTQPSPALSIQPIYRCTHTHTTCTRTLYIHNTLKIAFLTNFAQTKTKIIYKKCKCITIYNGKPFRSQTSKCLYIQGGDLGQTTPWPDYIMIAALVWLSAFSLCSPNSKT